MAIVIVTGVAPGTVVAIATVDVIGTVIVARMAATAIATRKAVIDVTRKAAIVTVTVNMAAIVRQSRCQRATMRWRPPQRDAQREPQRERNARAA